MDFDNMNTRSSQGNLDLEHIETLCIQKPVYLEKENTPIGPLSKLAIPIDLN